jgi:phosphopantetheinyl transferase (holo-ACP synthase)
VFTHGTPRAVSYQIGRGGAWRELFYYDAVPMWSHHPFTMCARRSLALRHPYCPRVDVGDDTLFLFDILCAGETFRALALNCFEWRNTFAELINGTGQPSAGKAAEVRSSAPRPSEGAEQTGGFAVGLDLEDVGNLPPANDPWNEPFYVEHFSPEEIAYAVRQADPRLTLCGLWSAKEAIIKLGGAFGELKPPQIQIRHDERRRPFAVIGGQSLAGQVDLSISHSAGAAAAISLRIAVPPTVRTVAEPPVMVAAPAPPPSSRLPLALALTGLLLALYAVTHLK